MTSKVTKKLLQKLQVIVVLSGVATLNLSPPKSLLRGCIATEEFCTFF